MACVDLGGGNICKKTGRACDYPDSRGGEYACPIAKHERRAAAYASRNSDPGVGSIIIGIIVLLIVIGCIGNCVCGGC